MLEWLKSNSITLTLVIAGVIASYSVNTALYGYRLTSIEARQDRQGTAITSLQTSVADVQTQYAALSAKLDAIDSNVTYIRNRLDSDR